MGGGQQPGDVGGRWAGRRAYRKGEGARHAAGRSGVKTNLAALHHTWPYVLRLSAARSQHQPTIPPIQPTHSSTPNIFHHPQHTSTPPPTPPPVLCCRSTDRVRRKASRAAKGQTPWGESVRLWKRAAAETRPRHTTCDTCAIGTRATRWRSWSQRSRPVTSGQKIEERHRYLNRSRVMSDVMSRVRGDDALG